jgi:Domain of unknown function (DUF5655)
MARICVGSWQFYGMLNGSASGLLSHERKNDGRTSIHLVRTVGFAGAHPRKSYLILNLRTDSVLESPRIFKSEQVSKNRFHNEVKLTSPHDVDEELLGWLKEAYALG